MKQSPSEAMTSHATPPSKGAQSSVNHANMDTLAEFSIFASPKTLSNAVDKKEGIDGTMLHRPSSLWKADKWDIEFEEEDPSDDFDYISALCEGSEQEQKV